METKLRKPEAWHYSIADHAGYNKVTLLTCIKFESDIQIPQLLEDYEAKVIREESIYKWMRKSEFTKKKLDTDHQRDGIFIGMKGIVHANMKSFDPTIRDHALHVSNLFDNYKNLTHYGYDAETAAFDSILERLGSADYACSVTALGLAPWIAELTTLNDLFKTYVDDTTQEQIKKPDISSKEARKETDDALRAITDRITAKINLEGPDAYVAFVKEFNVTTDHYNTLMHEHYGRLHTRIDIQPARIGNVDTQYYTGKPIYVIPSLNLAVKEKDGSVRNVDLVFSVDFTVGYQNNVEPGTAGITITGIGKYVGSIHTTFNIVKG
jgi:hypothetical protein